MGADHASTRLCSFDQGPLRSWTDIFTNHTFISSIGLLEYGPSLVGDLLKGAAPDWAIPQFLHEATHHSCMASPVGTALTILEHRCRDLIATGKADDAAKAGLYKLRMNVVLTFYRP